MKNTIILLIGILILSLVVNIHFLIDIEDAEMAKIEKSNFFSAEELASAVNELAWSSGLKLTSYESGEIATVIENYTLPKGHDKKIAKEELRGLTKDLSLSSYALWHQVILERYNISLALELIEGISGEQMNNN